MRDLASRIDAPEAFVPMCGRCGRQGWSVDISDDGSEYVFSASDKGAPYDLCRSTDRARVMEAVFVDVTERLARKEVVARYPPISFWRSLLGELGRPNPIRQQREIQIVEEALLSRINLGWGERRAIENAMRLRRDVDFYFGVQ
ncbi:hypothetical protein [Brevundimonas sp. LjRoot202]|uniref:hypothetical protein n=1 Tax=Brevundimonas sp. LjRoot202 TaxID=3342281 RepID=UPI003ECC5AA6